MSETFKQRRQQIIEKMPNNSLAVFFASDLIRRSADATYDFSVNRNFYYLCNCDEDGLILFIVKTEHSTTERLFIKDYNPTYEKWVGHSLKSEDANKQSGIERIHTISEFDEVLAHTLERNPITSILIDAERNSLNNREIEGEKFAKLIHKTYPAISV
ncbi:MAG: aminopeptidase P N-terminal domain-containing protein, partial [Erysipelotrichaceae bacterium]